MSTQIGPRLDTKGYGIATRPGSGFKDLLDQARTDPDGFQLTEVLFNTGAPAVAGERGLAPVESEMVETEERRRPVPKVSCEKRRGKNHVNEVHTSGREVVGVSKRTFFKLHMHLCSRSWDWTTWVESLL